jgi:ribosomal protein S18 acetylase RimI-like enzyme
MAVTVRRATLADAAVVAEFNRRLAHETENKTLDAAVLAKGVAAVLSDPAKGLYFLAERDQGVAGMMLITFEWSDWRNGWLWWIQSVYVRAEARRQGVLRALYDHVYQLACREPEVIGLRLYVENNNRVAQQTYLRLGMEPAGYTVFEKYPL